MMDTTMVLENGKPRLVLGSGGSNRIRTAILQVVSNVLDFGMDIDDAVNAPAFIGNGNPCTSNRATTATP
jgi:gamma-glutamyltranspeptidase/glutathione hydrolase